ncbi:MAG: hypothetical protein CMG50_03035 [Candidatus Marinimicrobia bacterium]|nr:hypothetical protein [Candidatus Neomarinimicrobiota bacterium]
MTEEKEILPFYIRLKEERQKKNCNLSQISDETKINVKHLQAIESGNFNVIPNTYLRLFIKTYAEYLKLDPKEILNQHELESNKKRKTILRSTKSSKAKKQKIDIRKTISNFNIYDSYYIKPKKIMQVIILFTFLISTYLLVSYLSKEQAHSIILNTKTENNREYMQDQQSNLPNDNILLNSKNFLEQNLIKSNSFKLNKEIGTNYTFQISTKENTKIYISYNDKDGARVKKCNLIVKKGELIKYTFSNNIYFDLLSAKHVQVAINNNSINKYLGKEDYSIRGSFDPQEKQLYLEFYSK